MPTNDRFGWTLNRILSRTTFCTQRTLQIPTTVEGASQFAGQRCGARIALRGLELCAALAIIAVGLLLLTGYMASERMFLV